MGHGSAEANPLGGIYNAPLRPGGKFQIKRATFRQLEDLVDFGAVSPPLLGGDGGFFNTCEKV